MTCPSSSTVWPQVWSLRKRRRRGTKRPTDTTTQRKSCAESSEKIARLAAVRGACRAWTRVERIRRICQFLFFAGLSTMRRGVPSIIMKARKRFVIARKT